MARRSFVTAAGSVVARGVVRADRPGTLRATTFQSAGIPLFARVFVPHLKPRSTVLLLHGFPGTELNFDIAHTLRRAGFLVVLPHYRGSWGMAGAYSFGNVISDAQACVAWMRSEKFNAEYEASVIAALIGYSLGGFAALQVGAAVKEVNIASIAAFDFGAFAEHERRNGAAVETIGRAWESSTVPLRRTSGKTLAREALDCPDEWRLRDLSVWYSGRNLLLIGATRDEVAPPGVHHRPLVKAFRQANAILTQKEFDTDHSFASARIGLCGAILDWITGIVHRKG